MKADLEKFEDLNTGQTILFTAETLPEEEILDRLRQWVVGTSLPFWAIKVPGEQRVKKISIG